MCMAAGIDPPAHVQVHGWLLVGGSRLSKTRIREQANDPGSTPINLTEISPEALTGDFGVDAIRYHLLRAVPLGTDGEFSYEGITARYNSDLANNLGNLVARVATVVVHQVRWHRACSGSREPAPRRSRKPSSRSRPTPGAGSRRTMRSKRRGDSFARRMLSSKPTEPWKAEPGPATDAVLGSALEALRIVALLILPAMPSTSAEIWRRIGLHGTPQERRLPSDAAWGGYPGGVPVVKGDSLFPRRKA